MRVIMSYKFYYVIGLIDHLVGVWELPVFSFLNIWFKNA